MPTCEVMGCKNYYNSRETGNIKYFIFPKNKDLREKWIQACGKKVKASKPKIFICASHFTDDDWRLQDRLLNVPMNKRRLKCGAIPTKNLPKMEGLPSIRMKRAHERARKRIVEEAIQSSFSPVIKKTLNHERPIQFEQHKQHEHYHYKQEQEQPEIILKNLNKMPVLGIATQTKIDFKCSTQLKCMQLEKQVRELKKRNRQLHRENIQQLRTISTFNNVNNLNNVFTAGQVKKLLNPEKGMKWSVNDICSAICLHSEGPRAYKYLRKKNFPLPSPATLARWTAKIKMKPGILSTVLNLMEHAPIVGNDRLCTLVFGEMKIRHKLDYDKASDSTISPSNYVQVVLARGLVKQWKQPVFYEYNCQISTAILNEIIAKLYEKGYVVVGITSDMEARNQGLWNELNITKENVWFPHPSNPANKVFVFADVGYVIKLLRNHFLDTGFVLRNAVINADPIREVLAATSVSDLKIAHKISDMHLNVRRVSEEKFATQLFSHSVSNAIRQCISIGKCDSEYALQCADFIKIVNDWLNVFNMTDSRQSITPFGLVFTEQKLIIDNMSDIISNMRVIGKDDLLPFQEGILISNVALLGLYNYIITRKYNLNCVFAYRLNQDTIENFFSAIRVKDGSHDYPSSIEFKTRLKSYLLGISFSNEIFSYKNSNNGSPECILIKGLLGKHHAENEAEGGECEVDDMFEFECANVEEDPL